MIYSIFVLCFLVFVTSASANKTNFLAYLTKFSKGYGEEHPEFEQRYQNYVKNAEKALKYSVEHPSATFGETMFSDLSEEEFASKYLNNYGTEGVSKGSSVGNVMQGLNINRAFNWGDNQTVDWNAAGALTPVKNQEQCGSCWAFSATEELESMSYMAGNQLVALAPQQIVDCDTAGSDQGCNGGFTEGAYAYIQSAGGMDTEASYPYKGRDGQCQFNADNVAAKLTGYTYAVNKCSGLFRNCDNACKGMEESLQQAPISVCLYAIPMQTYTGGIMSQSVCPDQRADHCVQLTGYSTDSNGKDYWIVRNSWSETWGEKGFIWLERGTGVNTCGLCNDATIVQAAKLN